MKKLLLALLLFACFTYPAFAASPQIILGNFQYNAVPAVDTTVLLHGYFRSLQIWSDSGSADIYVQLNNATATVGGATTIHIAPGGSWQSPANCNLGIESFHVIGSSASGHYTSAAFH